MSKNDQSLWNEGLKLISYCPLCEARYTSMEARVLGEEGETRLLHVSCKKCHGSVLALLLMNQVGVSSVGLITDLIFEDVVRFQRAKPIHTNDVISAHGFFTSPAWYEAFQPARVGLKKRSVRRSSSIHRKS